MRLTSIKPHLFKRFLLVTLTLTILYFAFYNIGPAIRYNVVPHPHPALLDSENVHPSNNDTLPNVSLVIASIKGDDISWAYNLPIPNLKVFQYVSNDPYAEYHPYQAKGREALMYFTYLHDFYDSLYDITIFVHADETPWHVEGTLLQNTSFALSILDLEQVQKRGYFNLRATWRAGCPAWINTQKTFADTDRKEEEPYMAEAWHANFGEDEVVPEQVGGPCCSQFAVTREAIRRRPREQYRRSMDWLLSSRWSDAVLGRVWEHMWPRLFTDDASDCSHPERGSLCQMYGVCFETDRQLNDYKELWEVRERLKEDMSFFRAVWDAKKAAAAEQRLVEVNSEIERQLSVALQRDNV
ncbi:hypothetical protein LTR56_025477 [Elasticomyces elasticus]|nr:hypothetical protein LTR56_025477 [Elasticomyces elasticus]KAK3624016.1 hypothetical protein LTR22_024144 [Elasticomyces elasticus]KAK4899072.1 hypothetical protein LTR49_027691 [Elasticomyces elasticus]KAK5742144.1 hypothetical protein LTS12_024355 [Elasticomyces elasticus]